MDFWPGKRGFFVGLLLRTSLFGVGIGGKPTYETLAIFRVYVTSPSKFPRALWRLFPFEKEKINSLLPILQVDLSGPQRRPLPSAGESLTPQAQMPSGHRQKGGIPFCVG